MRSSRPSETARGAGGGTPAWGDWVFANVLYACFCRRFPVIRFSAGDRTIAPPLAAPEGRTGSCRGRVSGGGFGGIGSRRIARGSFLSALGTAKGKGPPEGGASLGGPQSFARRPRARRPRRTDRERRQTASAGSGGSPPHEVPGDKRHPVEREGRRRCAFGAAGERRVRTRPRPPCAGGAPTAAAADAAGGTWSVENCFPPASTATLLQGGTRSYRNSGACRGCGAGRRPWTGQCSPTRSIWEGKAPGRRGLSSKHPSRCPLPSEH